MASTLILDDSIAKTLSTPEAVNRFLENMADSEVASSAWEGISISKGEMVSTLRAAFTPALAAYSSRHSD
jgi:hypothetical protein